MLENCTTEIYEAQLKMIKISMVQFKWVTNLQNDNHLLQGSSLYM